MICMETANAFATGEDHARDASCPGCCRWSGTANLRLIYEWGNDVKDEFESVLALQARYRMVEKFEPGVEFYSGQNTRGIGPVFQGTVNTGIRKKLHWETGVIFGLESKSPETSIRFLLEYEF